MERTGWCTVCTEQHLAERYERQQAAEIEARRQAWRRWDAARQRHSRLLRETKPIERLPAETDPAQVAHDLLKILNRTGTLLPIGVAEELKEGIKQLAAGPES